MRRSYGSACLTGLLFFLFCGLGVWAQPGPGQIFVNGRILTVDDKSFDPNLGRIAQAMAVRDGRLIAVGGNAQVEDLSGPGTQRIDLGGRTVLPGLIDVHEHPYDWGPVNPYIVRKVLTDDLVVTRIVEGSPQEQLQVFPDRLKEAVDKARPGQWIYLIFTSGRKYEYAVGGNGGFGQNDFSLFGGQGIRTGPRITKSDLDTLAPDNPVLVRDVFTQLVVNSRALELARKIFPSDVTEMIDEKTGLGGAPSMRWFFGEVMMQDHPDELKELQRMVLSWWAGYGMTTFGSQAYTPSNIKIYAELSGSDQMPIRNMWGWDWRENVLFADQYVLNASVFMEGLGNEFFWYGGARGAQAVGRGCSILRPLVELASLQTQCNFDPGSRNARLLYNYIKAGGRFTLTHMVGDREVDNLLAIVERASRDAGFSLDQVRAKRHTFDHLVMAPRPDQLERIKELGMVLGGDAFEIYESSPGILRAYGERALEWSVPKKSLVDARIPSGFEVDRALGSTDLTIFWVLARLIDRKAWDGKVYGESQRISRELALKTATTWGAYYLRKEDFLGSLETGKAADFVVLDRDFLMVPEEQIQDLRVLMTVVDGKIIHLVPSLARELGMPATGAQVELGGQAAQW